MPRKKPSLIARILVFWLCAGRRSTFHGAAPEGTRFVLRDNDIEHVQILDNLKFHIVLTDEAYEKLRMQVSSFQAALFFLVYIPPNQNKEVLITKVDNYKDALYGGNLLIVNKSIKEATKKLKSLQKFIKA